MPAIVEGRPAPDFDFDAGAGPQHLAGLRGRVVLINFWDTYCKPCADELPALDRARLAHPEVSVVTLSDQAPGVARAYLGSRGLGLPLAEDPERIVFGRYTVIAIPATVAVRPDGTVASIFIGQMEEAQIESILAAAAKPLP